MTTTNKEKLLRIGKTAEGDTLTLRRRPWHDDLTGQRTFAVEIHSKEIDRERTFVEFSRAAADARFTAFLHRGPVPASK